MNELSPKAGANDMKFALTMWEEEGQRNERAFAKGGSGGYGACPDEVSRETAETFRKTVEIISRTRYNEFYPRRRGV